MDKEKGLEIKSLHIKYIFTEDEKKESSSSMANKISEKEALEEDKKAVASKFTYQINELTAKINVLAQEFRQGYTYKNCDCYEIFDYDNKTVYTHRADTDEQVETRTMTTSEFQKDLFNPTEKITEGVSGAIQEAARMQKDHPAEFSQACVDLRLKRDPFVFSDSEAIKVCQSIKDILDSEDNIPNESPNDV